MSEKIKAIRGSKERAEEVKQWLIEHGAKDNIPNSCAYENRMYFIHEGKVDIIDPDYSFLFDVEELPRWRAKGDEIYHFVTDWGIVIVKIDEGTYSDDRHYEVGNYFRTKEDAEEVRTKFVELLKERK